MMKKTTIACLLFAALLSFAPSSVMAKTYDYSQFNWLKLIDVFHDALAAGDQYPEDEKIMKALEIDRADLEFIRSHVKVRPMLDQEGRLRKNTYKDRKFWMNTPMGSGSGADAGYPSATWHNDVFSLWNYTALWGSWNHSVGQIPGSWTDAAHKNGCDIMGGTVFFDSGSTQAYREWTTKAKETSNDPNVAYNGFKYVKPIINMLMYFGMDGININWEVAESSIGNYKQFHQALYKYADSIGFKNFHLGIYTASAIYLSHGSAQDRYADENGQIADLMLNYNGENWASESVKEAKKTSIGAKALYQGFWIVGMDHTWSSLSDEGAKEMNICAWGEHKDSRFWSYNSGSSTMDQQYNYQRFLERAFTGGNVNPLSRVTLNNKGNNMQWNGSTPPLSTWAGFSEWIPEHSTVKGKFPFVTNFCLGNGDRYNYRGKKVAGAWYNMSAQDIVPTYRWLVLKGGQKVGEQATTSTKIEAAFTHEDAFNGGSCLRLKGDATEQTDVVLYRTDLMPNDANTYALVATKCVSENAVNPKLILCVNGEWKAYEVPANNGKAWQEHNIKLNLDANSKIEYIGLRVEGGDNKYDVLVGEIQLNDGKKVEPIDVLNVTAKTTSMIEDENGKLVDVKLNWELDVEPNKYGVVYNCDEDVNIDHFEIVYRADDNANVVEVGRTSQWATLIPAINIMGAKKPQIGVVAVSKDLKTYKEPVWEDIDASTAGTAEKDPFGTYGQSFLDVNGEGYGNALKLRAVESFTTKNNSEGNYEYKISYEQFQKDNQGPNGEANGAAFLNYHHAKDTLVVRQGQTFDFYLKAFDAEVVATGTKDDCRYCFVGGWMDFDGSGTFNYGKGMKEQMFWKDNHAGNYANGEDGEESFPLDLATNDGTEPWGERVFRAGTLRRGNPCLVKKDGYHGQITIPEDAHLGVSRLRIVYSDAWFTGAFGPSSKTNKGYTLDIDVKIVGDNVANQRKYEDKHDMGDPDNWVIVTDIAETHDATAEPTVKVVDGTFVFENTQKAEIYNVNGVMLNSIKNPRSVYGKRLAKGVYVIRLNGKKTVKVAL